MTQQSPQPGPRVRTGMVQVYILRRAHADARPEFLQLRRTRDPMPGAWQPVLGAIEPAETATDAALREAQEETGLDRAHITSAWALESVDTFYMHRADELWHVPQFALEAPPSWQPLLNDEHDAHRWVPGAEVESHFMWPGQHRAIDEIERFLVTPSLAAEHLRIRLP